MTLPIAPLIEPLGYHHNRELFRSGEPGLDTYIRRQAGHDVQRRVSRVFVATLDDPTSIAGYYTLSAATVEARNLPSKLARKLPAHPLLAVLIGRFAVDEQHQGRGIGTYLLMDAVARTISASASIAIYAVVVDALNQNAQAFYEKHGFKAFSTMPKRLFLPLQTAFPRDEVNG